MNISKLFSMVVVCMLVVGLAITCFTSLGYASHEEASQVKEAMSEAESALEKVEEKADAVEDASLSTEDIQIEYGAKSELGSDEKEADAPKAEEKE